MPRSPSETVKSTLRDAADDLNPNETVLYRNHFHWTTVFWPACFAVLFLLPGVFAWAAVPAHGGSTGGTLVLGATGLFFVGVAAAILFVAHWRWKSREIILTNSRLMLTSGVIHAEITSIRLDRVQSTTVSRSLFGKSLGYGTVGLCHANGSLKSIKKIPHSGKLHRLLQNQLPSSLKFADVSEPRHGLAKTVSPAHLAG